MTHKDLFNSEQWKNGVLQRLLVGIVAISPAALLLRNVNNVFFYIFVVWGIISVLFGKRWCGKSFWTFIREYWPLWLAMAAIPFSALLNEILVGASSLRLPFRFLHVPLIAYAVFALTSTELKKFSGDFVSP